MNKRVTSQDIHSWALEAQQTGKTMAEVYFKREEVEKKKMNANSIRQARISLGHKADHATWSACVALNTTQTHIDNRINRLNNRLSRLSVSTKKLSPEKAEKSRLLMQMVEDRLVILERMRGRLKRIVDALNSEEFE